MNYKNIAKNVGTGLMYLGCIYFICKYHTTNKEQEFLKAMSLISLTYVVKR